MESQQSKMVNQPRSTLCKIVLHFTPCVRWLPRLQHCEPIFEAAGPCSL